jgi:hypothetical protein
MLQKVLTGQFNDGKKYGFWTAVVSDFGDSTIVFRCPVEMDPYKMAEERNIPFESIVPSTPKEAALWLTRHRAKDRDGVYYLPPLKKKAKDNEETENVHV